MYQCLMNKSSSKHNSFFITYKITTSRKDLSSAWVIHLQISLKWSSKQEAYWLCWQVTLLTAEDEHLCDAVTKFNKSQV